MIVGIVMGVVVLLILAAVGVICFMRKRARISQEEIVDQSSDEEYMSKKKDFIDEESVIDFAKKH